MHPDSVSNTLLPLWPVSLKMAPSVGTAGEMYIHGTRAEGGEEPPPFGFPFAYINVILGKQIYQRIMFQRRAGRKCHPPTIRDVLIKVTSTSLKKFSGGCFLQVRVLIEVVVTVLITLISMEIWSLEIMETRFCYNNL